MDVASDGFAENASIDSFNSTLQYMSFAFSGTSASAQIVKRRVDVSPSSWTNPPPVGVGDPTPARRLHYSRQTCDSDLRGLVPPVTAAAAPANLLDATRRASHNIAVTFLEYWLIVSSQRTVDTARTIYLIRH